MSRTNFASGAPWESMAGYSRAVRVGPWLCVAGTTATDESGNLVGEGDPAAQTAQVLDNIERAVVRAGGSLADVVRTRIFVTDIAHWEEVARVHGERMRAILPACTLVQVAALVDPRMLVEIEADAYLSSQPTTNP